MNSRYPVVLALALSALALAPAGLLSKTPDPLVQVDDAFVTADDDGRGWTIGNKLIRYDVGSVNTGTGVRSIVDATDDRNWARGASPDSTITINGITTSIGAAGSQATQFLRAEASEWWDGVRLDLVYRLPATSMEITRSYACYSGGAVIETWTTYRNGSAKALTLSNLNSYSLRVEPGILGWISGIQESDDNGGPFVRREGELEDGQDWSIGSDLRASDTVVPFFQITADDHRFFGAMLWGGSWRLRTQRRGDGLDVQLGLAPFSTSMGPGATLDTPHAIFGITSSAVPDVSMALRGFIDRGLRHGRPFASYVSYNTWYSYGTAMDESSLTAEMDAAAAMGLELFVVDAGWWLGSDTTDPGDYVHGWGTWTSDPDRFPNGLGALSSHAHDLGMKFGIWVEPERVDLATVGRVGTAQERFLAQDTARYDPSVPNTRASSAQVCFADSAARQWVTQKLISLIDEVAPDYLKWDNNFWINCNRAGHGHGAQDGNFMHTRGVQMVRDVLRNRYPDLVVEECASGAHRLSLAALATSDVAWVNDRTDPSSHVRTGLEGLNSLFPSPYLLSFLWPTYEEPVVDDPAFDLSYLMRSRMLGAFGLSYHANEFSEGTRARIAQEIAFYKRIRPILQESSSMLLTSQLVAYPDGPWSGWDVVEHLATRTGDAVVMAYDTADGPDRILVKLKGLRHDTIYDVESADYGLLGSVRGSELMADGIEIQASSISRAHVLVLRARLSLQRR